MSKEQLFELLDTFIDYLLQVRGYSEHTVDAYDESIREALTCAIFKKEANALVLDLIPYREKIASLHKKSIARHLSAIRTFVRYLKEQKGMTIMLIGDSAIKVPKTLPKPIEATYIKEVLECAEAIERVVLLMLYGLGLRIGELVSLRVENIEEEWVRIEGKGGKQRQLPLPLPLQTALQKYKQSSRPKCFLFEKEGVPMNSAQLRYLVQKAFKRCGIKATPHQLRHSFATHLLQEGARIADVSKLLGHTTLATTQAYTKLANSTKLEHYMRAHPLSEKKRNDLL